MPQAQPDPHHGDRVLLTPLVLVVHGRSGGFIPRELGALAQELWERRGSPVLLQAFTASPPAVESDFWSAAKQAGGLNVVPLLLLPGGHVRFDLPAIACHWRRAAAAQEAGPLPLRRWPFLGAWPQWQRLLAVELAKAAGGGPCHWLHHPLEGPLAKRYLDHLAVVLGCQGVSTPYTAQGSELGPWAQKTATVMPLTLAANRLTESLTQAQLPPGLAVLPPLLELPTLRQFLISALEALP